MKRWLTNSTDFSRGLRVAVLGLGMAACAHQQLTAPPRAAEISRSAPLAVTWSGATDGERAGITLQGASDDPRTIACEPTASLSAFEIPAKFLSVLEPAKGTVIGIAPANMRRLSVGDWTIDVIAYGLGGGYSVTVVP